MAGRADLAARVFLTLGALAPLLASSHLLRHFRHRRRLHVRPLQRRAPRTHHVRGVDPRGPAAGVDEPDVLRYPLGGAPVDPLGLALFTLLPPAAALDLLLIVLLLVAAHGTYSLARRLGADRTGAVLAGLGFAGSGYIATQLAHLSIISTIVWLPVGLMLIDRMLQPAKQGRSLRWRRWASSSRTRRSPDFRSRPTSVASSTDRSRCSARSPERELGPVTSWMPSLGGIAGALCSARGGRGGAPSVAGACQRLGSGGALDYQWATYTNFWPPIIFSFFVPYIYGDASDLTYIGPPVFWEITATSAWRRDPRGLRRAREWRRPLVGFLIAMTLVRLHPGPADAGLLRRVRPDSGHGALSRADALHGRRGARAGAAGRDRPDAGWRRAEAAMGRRVPLASMRSRLASVSGRRSISSIISRVRTRSCRPASGSRRRARRRSFWRTHPPRARSRRTTGTSIAASTRSPRVEEHRAVLQAARSPRAGHRRRILEHAVRRLLRRGSRRAGT